MQATSVVNGRRDIRICADCRISWRHAIAAGGTLGAVPRVPGVSRVVTDVWRCRDSAGHIRDNWRMAEKWEILLHGIDIWILNQLGM